MKRLPPHCFLFWACAMLASASRPSVAADPAAADLVIRHAHIITVDPQFSLAEAIAVRGERILAVGNNQEISRLIGPKTRVIEANGKTIMPGLYDSHVHSYRAAVSEFGAPMPVLNSLAEAFQHIREQTAEQPTGSWI